MHIRSIKENPLWLLVISVILFSVLVVVLLLLHDTLFKITPSISSQKTTIHPTSIPTVTQIHIAIPVLEHRQYQPSAFTTIQTFSAGDFTSKIASFVVDGLTEYARIDIPTTPIPQGGYPVVILDHGYIVPSEYNTVTSYESVESYFAAKGYMVVKPDYRGNGKSEGANDPLQRYNYPADVMTVLASLKNIPQANTHQVYLWGHSMGGEVTLTVLEILGQQPEIGKDVKAAVLWAPVTDPAKWFSPDNVRRIPEAILTPFPYQKTFAILGEPSDSSPTWQSINPLRFLSSISIPVQLNHGTADKTVPYNWSMELVQDMKDSHKQIDFISYPGADHNLAPYTAQALANSVQFFQSH